MTRKKVKVPVTRKKGARRPKSVHPRDVLKHMQKLVRRNELSIIKMVNGNDRRYQRVIDGSRVMLWAAVGWIDAGEATQLDRIRYPRVVG